MILTAKQRGMTRSKTKVLIGHDGKGLNVDDLQIGLQGTAVCIATFWVVSLSRDPTFGSTVAAALDQKTTTLLRKSIKHGS